MHPRHYRLRFVLDVLKNIVAPQVLLAIVFRLCRLNPGIFFRTTASILSVPAAGALRTWYKDRRDRAALSESYCFPSDLNIHHALRRSLSGRSPDSESSRQVAWKSGHRVRLHQVSP